MVAAMLVRETAIQMPIAQEALSASRGIIKMASLVAVMLGMGMLVSISRCWLRKDMMEWSPLLDMCRLQYHWFMRFLTACPFTDHFQRGIIAITLLRARHRLHLVSNSSTTVWMVAEVGAAKSARGTVTPMPIALEV